MRILSLFGLLLYGSLTFAAAPIPSCVASRTTGVAPLSVFFDATGTTDADTSRPFHDLQYEHSFGDSKNVKWTYGANVGASKNYAVGPVAAHVYETAGTYTYTCKIKDGSNIVSSSTSITVTSADSYFTTTNTLCVAAASLPVAGVDGCPAGASVLQQSSFTTAINSNVATHKRILFKHGDTFSAATSASVNVTGPGLIGMYGTGAKPIIQAAGNMPIITMSSAATPSLSDWRVMDLNLDGMSGTSAMGVAFNGTMHQATLLRLDIHDVQAGVQLDDSLLNYLNSHGYPGHVMWDNFALVDSTILHTVSVSGYGFYGGGTKLSILGTRINDTVASTSGHVMRPYSVVKGVISNNTLGNQGATNAVIKMHGPTWVDSVTPPVGVGAYGYTEKVVISGNSIIGAGTWSVNTGPQNGESDERLRDIILERNWFTAASGVAAHLVINAIDVTARNNIFDMSSATTGDRCIKIEKRGVASIKPPPLRVSILNNTFYSSTSTGATGVSIDVNATSTTVKNNLGYSPASASPALIIDAGSTGLVASNNSSDSQVKNTSPSFATTPPTTPAQFRITAGSYALNVGTNIYPSIFSDFFGCYDKTGSLRMGALVPAANAMCVGGYK